MFDRIEAFIQREIGARRIPGAAMAVVRGGELAWSRGFGVTSTGTGEPFTPETVFPVQSLSKVVTATAIMQLRDKGLFSLDDIANDHLGPVQIRNEWEAESPVTVRQLLTHTSGLPCDVDAATPQLDRSVPLADWVNSVAKTVVRPGGDIVYANWGYDALGPLIDHVAGRSWEGVVDSGVFASLGMKSSRIGEPVEGAPTATGHFLSLVDSELHTMRPMWPVQLKDTSGSVCSTVDDMSRFLGAHLSGGGPLVSSETSTEMQRIQASEGVDWSGMGLGWRVTRSNARKLICHGGDGSGFTNFMGGYPELGIGIVLTLNRGGLACSRPVIANTVLGMLAGDEKTSSAGPRIDLTRVPGAYRSTYWDVSADLTLEGDVACFTITEGLVVSDAGEASRLKPQAGGRFWAEGGMFHGFDVALREADGGVLLSGGLYPFTFKRAGELGRREELAPDVSVDLTGTWRGTVTTPLGAMMFEVAVENSTTATASTLFAQNIAVEECSAKSGRISGRFAVTAPAVGEMVLHPRLVATGRKLMGCVYAWGWFGEIAFPAELQRV